MTKKLIEFKEINGETHICCAKCKEFKPANNFYFHSRNNTYQRYCKKCSAEYSKLRNTKEKNRESTLRKYNLTFEQYDDLYKEQEGKCAICETKFELLHIDHDHKLNEVRGLLCNPCNNALGLFKDDMGLLHQAISYLLKRHIPK